MEREYQDNDYKYFMQDSGTIYLGGRYSYQEILENEMVSFKFKSIIEHYIAKDTDLMTTLESHLYYMTQDQFSYRTYKQLKARVKISVLREKKTLFGGTKVGYQTETVKLDTFTQWNLAQKKKQGVIVQELILSKLALMTFTV
jgi:hypothetical protein